MNLTVKGQKEKIKSIQEENYIKLNSEEEYYEILEIMHKAGISASGVFGLTDLWSNFRFNIHNEEWSLTEGAKSLKKMSFEQFKELITVKDYEIH